MEGEPKAEKQTFSRQEAANYLGIHINTLDNSDIPRIRFGRKVLFRLATLNMFVEEMERKSRGPKCKK